MKMTKRIAAMAMCGIMAASAMVGVSASAADVTNIDNHIISEFERNDSEIVRIAAGSKTLSVTVTKQEKSNWCWAACTQAILSYNNKTVSQSDIVTYVKGSDSDVGGNTSNIADALNHFLDVTTYKSHTGNTKTYSTMVTKIKNSKPIVLAGHYTLNSGATSDHAVVCYGYNSQNSKELKLYIKSPTTSGAKSLTFVCSSETATSYDMYEGNTKIGTYEVTSYAVN